MQEFVRIRSNHENHKIRTRLLDTEDWLMDLILVEKTGLCDLNKLSDLIDLFIYLPNRDHNALPNHSKDIFNILSPTKDKIGSEKSKPILEQAMESIWGRIHERFGTFSKAFRIFDRTGTG